MKSSATSKISADYVRESAKKLLSDLINSFLKNIIRNLETEEKFLGREESLEALYKIYRETAQYKISKFLGTVEEYQNSKLILADLRKYLARYWKILIEKRTYKKHFQANLIEKDFLVIAILVIFKEIDGLIFKNNPKSVKIWKIIQEIDIVKSYLTFKEKLLEEYWGYDETFLNKTEKGGLSENYLSSLKDSLPELEIELKEPVLTLKDLKILKHFTRSVFIEAKNIYEQLDNKNKDLISFFVIATEELSIFFNKIISKREKAVKRAEDLILVSKNFVGKNISNDVILDFNRDGLEDKINLGSYVAEKIVNYCGTNMFLLNRVNNIKNRLQFQIS